MDETLRLLAHPVRREVLFAVADSEDDVRSLDDLTEQVVEAERDGNEEAIRAKLHHQHLPMLQQAGLVEYDPRSETLRSREPPPVVADLVDAVKNVSEKHG